MSWIALWTELYDDWRNIHTSISQWNSVLDTVMTCQSNGICWWNVFMQVSKVDCISIYRWPISSHWDRLWYLKYLFVFLIERKDWCTRVKAFWIIQQRPYMGGPSLQGVVDECGSEYRHSVQRGTVRYSRANEHHKQTCLRVHWPVTNASRAWSPLTNQ